MAEVTVKSESIAKATGRERVIAQVDRSLDTRVRPNEETGHELDRQALYRLSEPSFLRIWHNDLDAAYDGYEALYDLITE